MYTEKGTSTATDLYWGFSPIWNNDGDTAYLYDKTGKLVSTLGDKMESFKVTLDRIEDDIAVLLVRDEEKIRINIPFSLLPLESREGDILDITIARDVKETEDAKERVSNLLEKLKKKHKESE